MAKFWFTTLMVFNPFWHKSESLWDWGVQWIWSCWWLLTLREQAWPFIILVDPASIVHRTGARMTSEVDHEWHRILSKWSRSDLQGLLVQAWLSVHAVSFWNPSQEFGKQYCSCVGFDWSIGELSSCRTSWWLTKHNHTRHFPPLVLSVQFSHQDVLQRRHSQEMRNVSWDTQRTSDRWIVPFERTSRCSFSGSVGGRDLHVSQNWKQKAQRPMLQCDSWPVDELEECGGPWARLSVRPSFGIESHSYGWLIEILRELRLNCSRKHQAPYCELAWQALNSTEQIDLSLRKNITHCVRRSIFVQWLNNTSYPSCSNSHTLRWSSPQQATMLGIAWRKIVRLLKRWIADFTSLKKFSTTVWSLFSGVYLQPQRKARPCQSLFSAPGSGFVFFVRSRLAAGSVFSGVWSFLSLGVSHSWSGGFCWRSDSPVLVIEFKFHHLSRNENDSPTVLMKR